MNQRLWNLNQTLRAHLSLVPLGCQCRDLDHDFRCAPGQTYRCADCKRLVAYCFGADDEYFDLCDDCYCERVREVAS